MREELLKGLTKEQIEKASKCRSQEELIAIARQEGVELTDEQLAAINGGCVGPVAREGVCPTCGAHVAGEFLETTPGDGKYHFICTSCGHDWFEK